MTTPLRNLIVTGATGKQGGALISALLSKGQANPFKIYAITRNPTSRSAQSLATNPNISIIKGDLDNSAAVLAQIPQPWGVFGVTLPLPSARVEEANGKKLVDAATAAGVEHFVFTSADRGGDRSNDDATYVPHFASKHRIEKHLQASGMDWTILRPVAFFENLTPDFLGKAFTTMWQQLGERRLQLISTKDVGKVAAEVFLNAEAWKGKAVSLAGDELNQREAAKIFKEEMGREMPETYGFVGSAIKVVLKEQLGLMFQWFTGPGFGADIGRMRKTFPYMEDFRTWLKHTSKFENQAA